MSSTTGMPGLSDALAEQYAAGCRPAGYSFTLSEAVPEPCDGFGLDLDAANEGDTGPVPATCVVGIVRYAFVDADYTRRAEPANTFATLDAL
jgi:hypothetical protein